MKTFCLPKKSSRGFTLVEIMVGMVIALLGVIIIFQVFAVSEGYRRTTTSGGDAVQSGAIALFTLEREGRQAGYGINNTDFLGCLIQGLDNLTGTAFTLELIPVKITQGALGAPDTITVMYGNGYLLTNPANISQNMPNASSDFKVDNRYGFMEGDLVVAAEAGKDCSLSQVSNLPGNPGQTDNLIHNPGNYTDPDTGQQVAIRYNPSASPPGSGISYSTNAKLFNLGDLPSNNIYSVQNGQLMLQQLLFAAIPAAATPLYDGIVQLQAQYGRDTTGDGVVDVFDEFAPANAADWATVLAVRLAQVARSSLREKPDPATGVCNTTTVLPTWSGGPITLTDDTDGTSWKCYRYKTYETTVPLRNMIWRPS